ncbi:MULTISPECIES: glutathione S-transferase family protein [unclassified Cupriavidus]|uniref:glutathione S-transferase family protein n=1 Tax=Cupriavidus sp. H19C3 TaxID=3241603 RepID=UPI003BF7CC1B
MTPMTPPSTSLTPVPGRINLFWSPRSPFVRRVLVTAHELGIADRVHRIDTSVSMTGCNDELMRLNPLNKIPTLVFEDGSTLCDSAMICDYLADTVPASTLVPADAAGKRQSAQWHALGHGLTDLLVLWVNELRRPESLRSAQIMAAWNAKAAATLKRLDQDAAALTQAPLTPGHIAIACALGYLDFRFAERPWRQEAPALARWFETFDQRASMRETAPPA